MLTSLRARNPGDESKVVHECQRGKLRNSKGHAAEVERVGRYVKLAQIRGTPFAMGLSVGSVSELKEVQA